MENNVMENKTSNAFSSDVRTDLQTVLERVHAGQPLDGQLLSRVAERSRKAQEELVRKYGVRELAVELIREGRADE